MKTFAKVCLIVLLLALSGAAQSGRKIQPVPTPAPVPEATPPPDYSESQPGRERFDLSLPAAGINRRKTEPKTVAADDNTGEIIRIETNLITIPVAVFDRNGLYIPNLTKENFSVFEDSDEQEIAYFGTTEQAFTVVLLLDTSPSTVFKIEEIQEAAIAFTELLKPDDRVLVIEFDENIHVLTEATSDRKKLAKAIRKADMGGGTSIYDAVDFTLRKRLDKIRGRKAIVLFTDGVDTTSDEAGFNSTLRYAEEADTLVFPIYYNTLEENLKFNGTARGTSPEEYKTGLKYLDALAELTGGRIFRSESTTVGLERAFKGIAEELRRQYVIGYYPKETGKPGQRKQLRVRVNQPNLIIRARGSYIVGGN